VAPLVVLIGILALVQDSWPHALLHHGQFHVLFGALLWIGVVMRFYAFQNQSHRSAADLRAFSRGLSRRVYLLLYLLMLLRLIIGMSRGPLHPVRWVADDFQVYLACGGIALVTIHLLAAVSRYFAQKQARVALAVIQRNGRLT
jgi:cytochrome b561